MLVDFYPYILSLHIVSFIAWMAGLLYLPRIFVYHCQVEKKSQCYQIFLTMERKLLQIIMLPALLATWGSGLTLLHIFPEFIKYGWMHSKFMLVIMLSAYHGILKIFFKKFKKHDNKKNQKFFRIINEIPTVVMILIVLLVVVKPF